MTLTQTFGLERVHRDLSCAVLSVEKNFLKVMYELPGLGEFHFIAGADPRRGLGLLALHDPKFRGPKIAHFTTVFNFP